MKNCLRKNIISRRQFGKYAAAFAAALGVSESFAATVLGAEPGSLPFETTKEAWNYQRLSDNRAVCNVCPRACSILPGRLSHCKAKKNIGGRLYSLSYGQIGALHLDPVEKGPLYHFNPGQRALAIGPAGCNLHCAYCQNWQVSQFGPLGVNNTPLSVKKAITETTSKKLSALVFTYTEPVTYPRYLMDLCSAAKKENLLTHVVTGGYVKTDPLKQMSKDVDAFTIGLKGWNPDYYKKVIGGKIEPVKDAIRTVAKMGKWQEIVTLLVPTLNDDDATIRGVAHFVKNEAGPNVPLHFLRFVPSYKLRNLPPTPISTLDKARKIALDEGLRYVYLGNVPGHQGQNTFCPSCKRAVVIRVGYEIVENKMSRNRCEYCGTKLAGVWA